MLFNYKRTLLFSSLIVSISVGGAISAGQTAINAGQTDIDTEQGTMLDYRFPPADVLSQPLAIPKSTSSAAPVVKPAPVRAAPRGQMPRSAPYAAQRPIPMQYRNTPRPPYNAPFGRPAPRPGAAPYGRPYAGSAPMPGATPYARPYAGPAPRPAPAPYGRPYAAPAPMPGAAPFGPGRPPAYTGRPYGPGPYNPGFSNNRPYNIRPYDNGYYNNRQSNSGPFSNNPMDNFGFGPFSKNSNTAPWETWPFGGRDSLWNRREIPFKDKSPVDWVQPEDPKEGLAVMWDDLISSSDEFGEMPGGWYVPSIGVPNPVDLEDQLEKASKEIPDLIRIYD